MSKLADPDRHGAQALRLDEVEMLLAMAQQRLQLAATSTARGARTRSPRAMLDGIDDPGLPEPAPDAGAGTRSARRAGRRSGARCVGETRPRSKPSSHACRRRKRWATTGGKSWWQRVASRLVDVQPQRSRAAARGERSRPRRWKRSASNSPSRAPRSNAAMPTAWRRRSRAPTHGCRACGRIHRRCAQQQDDAAGAARAAARASPRRSLGSTLAQLRSMRAR